MSIVQSDVRVKVRKVYTNLTELSGVSAITTDFVHINNFINKSVCQVPLCHVPATLIYRQLTAVTDHLVSAVSLTGQTLHQGITSTKKVISLGLLVCLSLSRITLDFLLFHIL